MVTTGIFIPIKDRTKKRKRRTERERRHSVNKSKIDRVKLLSKRKITHIVKERK